MSYYWINKNKSTPFFAAVPGGLTAQEHNAWIHYGGGQALWDELYGEFDVKGFLGGNTGVQMGGWFNKEIKSLNDFKGLKMRMPGLGAEVINRMGATAVSLPGGEIMPALQSGAIDATEWVGPWNDLAFGFYKVANNYYGPGFHEPGSHTECIVNKKAFNALPIHLQKIVEHACISENNRMLSEFTYANNVSQVKLIELGVNIQNFPNDVYKEMFKISKEVVAETANEGDINKRIYNSWSKFKKEAKERGSFAEQGYMNRRG
jgi:TRAP-type mannitol/chloroaromatic compound transport system substrate-binding protein